MSISKEIKEAINKVLPESLKLQIKEQVKLSTQVKLTTAQTTDGQTISFDGVDITIGSTPMVVNTDGSTTPLPDGDYTTDNSQGVTVDFIVQGGKVIDVEPAEVEASKEDKKEDETASDQSKTPVPDATAQKMQAHKKEFNEALKTLEVKLSKQIKDLRKENLLLKESNKVLLKMADALTATPVIEKKPSKEVSSADWSKLSALEKRRILREENN